MSFFSVMVGSFISYRVSLVPRVDVCLLTEKFVTGRKNINCFVQGNR